MRFAIGLEYCGGGFRGWQTQPGERTVQDCVETALSRVADERVSVVTAGRTDTGVHATGQVAHFDTGSRRHDYSWLRGTNSALPPDVSVLWVRSVADDFHARFSAISRSYRYVIFNRPVRDAILRHAVTWDYRPLDAARMHEASQYLLGEHDFSAFRASGCQARTAVRSIYEIEVRRHADWICIDVRANAYLQHMVRNLVGVLTAVGAREQDVPWVGEVLRSRDRRCGGVTAPASGLYLTAVDYPARFCLPQTPSARRFW